jgi:hypothetical protein
MFKRWMLAGLVVLLLAACGEDESDNQNSRPRNNDSQEATALFTLMPIPDMTIVPGCPPGELEDWFEAAYFNMQSFTIEADENRKTVDDSNRDDALLILSRLINLRDVIAMTATPTCVQLNSQQVLTAMQAVIDGFQQFTSGEINKTDLGEKVSPYITSLNGLLTDLQSIVNPLYELTPSSSSDSTSAPE